MYIAYVCRIYNVCRFIYKISKCLFKPPLHSSNHFPFYFPSFSYFRFYSVLANNTVVQWIGCSSDNIYTIFWIPHILITSRHSLLYVRTLVYGISKLLSFEKFNFSHSIPNEPHNIINLSNYTYSWRVEAWSIKRMKEMNLCANRNLSKNAVSFI